MSTHTVAEAKNQLSKLIDRALKGEGIVITRRGQPVVELKPVRPVPHPIVEADIDGFVRGGWVEPCPRQTPPRSLARCAMKEKGEPLFRRERSRHTICHRPVEHSRRGLIVGAGSRSSSTAVNTRSKRKKTQPAP
jgi:prevent-host-death family protein